MHHIQTIHALSLFPLYIHIQARQMPNVSNRINAHKAQVYLLHPSPYHSSHSLFLGADNNTSSAFSRATAR